MRNCPCGAPGARRLLRLYGSRHGMCSMAAESPVDSVSLSREVWLYRMWLVVIRMWPVVTSYSNLNISGRKRDIRTSLLRDWPTQMNNQSIDDTILGASRFHREISLKKNCEAALPSMKMPAPLHKDTSQEKYFWGYHLECHDCVADPT